MLCAEGICVIGSIHTVNSDSLHKNQQIVPENAVSLCFLWGINLIFECHLDKFQS
jgi:hypothetical protein